jgi:hypothetical protein
MIWRRLRADETDHEIVWLCVSLASFALAVVWLKWHLPVPRCFFHEATGLPCPTCGATRCMRALIAGNFSAALRWNPLFFFVLAAGVLFDCYAAVVLLFRLPRLRFEKIPRRAANAIRACAVTLVLANWFYLVCAGR